MAGGDEPPYLSVGTEVSAKYRGAFCEARVKKVQRLVKCKVLLKESQTSVMITDEDVKGPLKIGAHVEIKKPESGNYVEATISKLTDSSLYTVVFDDADEKTLRRTQLCLKGEKHFLEGETLDQLPLTHPEHFGTPVMHGSKKGSKRRRSAPAGSDSESDESSESVPPKKRVYKGRLQDMIGRIYLMEVDKRKSLWSPVLIVNPNANEMDLPTKDHLLVRSFKDSRFYTVARKELKDFTRDVAIKNEEKLIKLAMEKALSFFDTRELPSNWDKTELLGTDSEDEGESDSSDDEPSEEKDRFVAQLYKFMDDRGTPINKAPTICSRDLSLYKLFKIVHNIGGYNKVTNQMKWRLVYSKMNLPQSTNSSNQIKVAYKKYLHAFEDFYRKLGNTMGTMSRPVRSRHNSGPGRSILSFRERDKDPIKSPKSPHNVKKTGKGPETDHDEDKTEVGEKVEKVKANDKTKSDEKKTVSKEEKVGMEIDTDSPRKSRSQTEKKAKESVKMKDEKESAAEELQSAIKKKDEVKKSKDEPKNKNKDDEKRSVKAEAESPVVKKELEEIKQPKKRGRKKSLQGDEAKQLEEELDKKDEKTKLKKEEKIKEKKEQDKKEEKKILREEKKSAGKEDKKANSKDEKKAANKEDKKMAKEEKKQTATAANKDEKKIPAKDEKKIGKEEKKSAIKEDKKASVKEDSKSAADKKTATKDEKKKEDAAERKDTREKRRRDHDAGDADDSLSDKEAEENTVTRDKAVDQLEFGDKEYLAGTKLKVRYGRGRNQKIYDAKVVEAEREAGSMHFLVHYAGWNNRYDEWIKKDRIVSVTTDDSTKKTKTKTQSPKLGNGTNQKKRERSKTAPAPVTTGINSDTPNSQSQTRPAIERQQSANRKSPISAAPTNRSRPTRSTSLETPLSSGLLSKRRSRRSSGITESSDQQSHVSDSEEDDMEESSLPDSENVAPEEAEATSENQESKSAQNKENSNTPAEPVTQKTKPEKPEAPVPVPSPQPAQQQTTQTTETTQTTTSETSVSTTDHEEKQQPQQEVVSEVVKEEKPEIPCEVLKPEADTVKTEEPCIQKVDSVPCDSKTDAKLEEESEKVDEVKDTQPAKEVSESEAVPVAPEVTETRTTVLSTPAETLSTVPKKEVQVNDQAVKKDTGKTPKAKKKEIMKEKKRRASVDSKLPVTAEPAVVCVTTDEQIKEEPEEKKMKMDTEQSKVVPAEELTVVKETAEPQIKKDKKKEEASVSSERKEVTEATVEENVKTKKAKTDKQKNKSEKTAASKAEKPDVKTEQPDKEESTSPEKKVDGEKKKIKKKVKKKKEKLTEEKELKEKEKESKKVKDEYDFDDDSLCDISEMRPLRAERDRIKESRKARETQKSESEKQPTVPDDNTLVDSKPVPQQAPASPSAPAIEPQDNSKPPQLSTCFSDSVPILERVQPVLPYNLDSSALGASSTAVLDNTPPDTPENSPPPALPPPELSPSHEGSSTKSENELPLEVDTVNNTDSNSTPQSGGDSPNTCDTSIASTGSSGGSSGNIPGSESSGEAGPLKRKHENTDAPHSKRRKRSKKSALVSTVNGEKTRSRQHAGKTGNSDSEEAVNQGDSVPSLANHTAANNTSPSKRPGDTAAVTVAAAPTPRSPRPSKYNFNLEEGKYLEGEKRIDFLTSKIGEIRKIYMQLKAEVAAIDRRRKRARRKEREGKPSQVSTQQIEVECS